MNRFYLIFSVIVSLVFPLLNVSLGSDSVVNLGFVDLTDVLVRSLNNKPEPILLEGVTIEYDVVNWSFGTIFFYIYLAGFSIFFIRFVLQFILFIKVIDISRINKIGRLKFIYTEKEILPFSFFNRIIFNPEKHAEHDLEKMIAHERIHASQFHSADIMLIEILVVLQWFNPFIYQLRRSIIEIHEYLADDGVIESGIDRTGYQKLLLQQVIDNRASGLTSQFSYSLSKKRLKMMTRIKSGIFAKVKVIAAMPLFIIVFIVFSCSKTMGQLPPEIPDELEQSIKSELPEAQTLTTLPFKFEKGQKLENDLVLNKGFQYGIHINTVEGSNDKAFVSIINNEGKEIAQNRDKTGTLTESIEFVSEYDGKYKLTVEGENENMGSALLLITYSESITKSSSEDSSEVYYKVDEMPTFEGGDTDNFRLYIQKNLTYPKVAAENKEQGRVYITFIVEKDGKVSTVKVARGVSKALDDEAIRVVKTSPEWTPGKHNGEKVRVAYTFPIIFQLN